MSWVGLEARVLTFGLGRPCYARAARSWQCFWSLPFTLAWGVLLKVEIHWSRSSGWCGGVLMHSLRASGQAMTATMFRWLITRHRSVLKCLLYVLWDCLAEDHFCLESLLSYFMSLWNYFWGVLWCLCQAGQWLANGYCACVWALLGDQDYKRDCLLLPNVNSNMPCAHCPCNTTDVPWFDFRRQALWVGQIIGSDQWLASAWNLCELFKMKGVSILSVYPDWMHDKNLGSDKVIPAS